MSWHACTLSLGSLHCYLFSKHRPATEIFEWIDYRVGYFESKRRGISKNHTQTHILGKNINTDCLQVQITHRLIYKSYIYACIVSYESLDGAVLWGYKLKLGVKIHRGMDSLSWTTKSKKGFLYITHLKAKYFHKVW